MYENMSQCGAAGNAKELKRQTDADKVLAELNALVNKAEMLAQMSDKLTKIIQDRPQTCADGIHQPREQYAPLWADFANGIDRVQSLLRIVETRLREAEV